MTQQRRRPHTNMVLTQIEKLNADYPEMTATVKGLLDRGISIKDTPGYIKKIFNVDVTEDMVEVFRDSRYFADKELTACKAALTRAAVEAFGGDAGVDAMLLAKVWELMDRMTIPQILAARTLFIRVRAQNLKEQEFLYKTGQLKIGDEAEKPDRETQQKNVLHRIKQIFGLVSGQPLEEEDPAPPAAATTEKSPVTVARAAPETPAQS